jgi:hypothetical protein
MNRNLYDSVYGGGGVVLQSCIWRENMHCNLQRHVW